MNFTGAWIHACLTAGPIAWLGPLKIMMPCSDEFLVSNMPSSYLSMQRMLFVV